MVHSNYPSNRLNQTTAEQGFGANVVSGTLDDVARQRGDGVPQVRPQGCFSRLPLRQRKQQPALVSVNGQPAKVMSEGGSAPYTFKALVDLAEGDNTVTIEAEDGNGNVATQSYSVTAGGVQKTLEYHLNGNLRYEKGVCGTVLREFQWDAINRLVKIIDGTHVSELEYDALDRRVRIVEKENAVVQSDETYLWVDGDILQKRASNGQTVRFSYFADGFVGNSNDYYYTKDHLGSIREVVASDGTTIESVYDYSPWGEMTKIGGSGVESDFLYTGHFYHDKSDLHLTLYRAYNPELGMWLSRDPIAENGGLNLYAYVGNDPVNWWDPLGLQKGRRGWNPPNRSKCGNSYGDYAKYTVARMLEGMAAIGNYAAGAANISVQAAGDALSLANDFGLSGITGAAGDIAWTTGESFGPMGRGVQGLGFGLQLTSSLMDYGDALSDWAQGNVDSLAEDFAKNITGSFSDQFLPNSEDSNCSQ